MPPKRSVVTVVARTQLYISTDEITGEPLKRTLSAVPEQTATFQSTVHRASEFDVCIQSVTNADFGPVGASCIQNKKDTCIHQYR